MSIDNRMSTLISIGASVGANCLPCLQYLVTKARENGIGEQEIQEAINVGRMVRQGAATKMDQYSATLCSGGSNISQSADMGCGCGCGDAC